MHISTVDKFRIKTLEREWQVPSFRDDHPHFKTEWKKILGPKPSENDIRILGENLRSIMKSFGGNRNNTSVSRGGNAFECLVSWYLNLLFWGTPVIVGKATRVHLPEVFADITTVSINQKKSTSETDLIAFSIPESEKFSGLPSELNEHIKQRIKDTDLTIIQTKTPWNENSQIPMLWNLIYNVAEFRVPNITIGNNGFTPLSLNSMTYAFVTLPSKSDDKMRGYKSSSIDVKRVESLSGGNFWCCPSKEGVASALHNFPLKNFPSYIAETATGNLWGHVNNNLEKYPNLIRSFLDLNFDSFGVGGET